MSRAVVTGAADGSKTSSQTETVVVYVKLAPKTVVLEPEFTRDVENSGHYGTGNLEVRIRTDTDLQKAKPLIAQRYERN